MSDIFISYARSTEREARAIGEALRGLGYGVWRDDELPAHRAYADVIAERLAAARAVVVVWSAEAAKSEWVRSEAEKARAGRKLVQLRLDAADLPMPFDQIQCAELAGWTGQTDHPGWRKVAESVGELIGGSVRPVQRAQAPTRTQSICVLPFANISDDPQQEYFSDGISEDIITDLNKVSALFVVARNTAFAFKGKALPVTQVARELGVKHVLEGSVRKAGNRVRITAQLIDGETGGQVWAERWDRDLTDIFALQDEISEAIVAALKVKLAPEEKKAIETRGTDNVEAYNLYLMARRRYLTMSAKRFDLVVRLCQGAIDLDPNYARAWALLAQCKAALSASYSGKAGDGWDDAEKALELDPNLAEAHAAKAKILVDKGRFADAQLEANLAIQLDPHSGEANGAAGNCAIVARRFEDAIRYFEAAAAADEFNGSVPFMAMQCYLAIDDHEGARASARMAVDRLEKAAAREPDNGSLLALGVGALVILGQTERAQDWTRQALLIDPEDGNLRYNLACATIRLGDLGKAIELLDAAFEMAGSTLVEWAKKDSDLDPLRDDPRFEKLMATAEARISAAGDDA